MIRKAGEHDVTAIAQVHLAAWGAAYLGLLPDEVIQRHTLEGRCRLWGRLIRDREGTVLVALDGERVLGFAHLAPSRDSDADRSVTGELVAIYIDPPAWRLGHGGRLLARCEREATSRRFKRLTLWVLETNLAARNFYERHHYRADGASKLHEPSGTAELRYAKPLGEVGS